MKHLFFLNLFIVFGLTALAQQDTIANAGLEDWTPAATYDEPNYWTTLNPSGVIIGAELAFQATADGEFHSGVSAVKLVTAEVQFFGIIPSILTTGEVNVSTQEVEGGWPISSRPASFGGWFRYDTLTVDTGFVSITLTKWNSTTGMTEIIGSAEQDIVSTDSLFENIELLINYVSTETPDTVLILSGSGGNDAQSGSALFVDDLYYIYPPAGIETPESIGLSIFPNPATDRLNLISTKGVLFNSVKVYSTDGRLVQSLNVNGNSVNVSSLNFGLYIIELNDGKGTVVRQRFSKN